MTCFRSDGWVKSVLGQAVAGAQVYVCSQPADISFVPPLPQVPLFSDASGATPLSQPVITDGFGHYDFYVPYGTYTVVIVNSGKIQQVYPDQTIGFSAAGGGAVSSVFGRVGDVSSQSGDYNVSQITGAAPSANPSFTGTIQIVNAVITGTLRDGASSVGTPGQLLSSTGTGTAWITSSGGGGSTVSVDGNVLASPNFKSADNYVFGISGSNVTLSNGILNAAGIKTTTTGTISSGTNSLVVASATGWKIGMGIAVANAGAGGTTELITTVTNIVGTTFTLGANALANATAQTVNHDDTAAIAAAIATGGPVYLPAGNYNITSEFTISAPIKIEGSGPGATIIWVRFANIPNGVFHINYQIPGGSTTVTGNGCVIRDLEISSAAGITPTHGFAINVASASGTGFYTTGVHIEDIHINNLFGGIFIGSEQISNWFRDIYIVDTVAYGIYYDCPNSGGDDHFENIEMTGPNTGLTIINSDTTEFSNLKINGSEILFAAPSAASNILRVRFVNASVEGSPTQWVDFGANGCTQVSFIGGQTGGGAGSGMLTNQGNAVGLQIIGMNINNSNTATLSGVSTIGAGVNYTPTVTAFTGAFATASATGRYFVMGKLVFLTLQLTVTSVGTASVAAILSLPFAAAPTNKFAIVGREVSQTGDQFSGTIDPASSTTTVVIKQYDNSFGLGNNYVVNMTGFYEAA